MNQECTSFANSFNILFSTTLADSSQAKMYFKIKYYPRLNYILLPKSADLTNFLFQFKNSLPTWKTICLMDYYFMTPKGILGEKCQYRKEIYIQFVWYHFQRHGDVFSSSRMGRCC